MKLMEMRGRKAYPDGLCTTTGNPKDRFSNASDRPACTIITDRGVAMIPLPDRGRTLDWWMYPQKKISVLVLDETNAPRI